jgi:hypothetical protein
MQAQSSLVTLAIVAVSFLSGCQHNAFTQYYQPSKQKNDPSIYLPHTENIEIYTTTDPQLDARELQSRGYIWLGVSSFEGTIAVTKDMILDQARRVDADVVLYKTNYLRSEVGVRAIPQYNPGQLITTNSSGTVTANAYGSGGNAYGTANYNGTATTTTSGTFSTQYVPTTLNRYSHQAGFFKKSKMGILGIFYHNLPEALRSRLERNTGVEVDIVVVGGPAFLANIMRGDVIIKIQDDDVLSDEDFQVKLSKYANTKVKITFLRNGQEKVVEVQLNPPREVVAAHSQ